MEICINKIYQDYKDAKDYQDIWFSNQGNPSNLRNPGNFFYKSFLLSILDTTVIPGNTVIPCNTVIPGLTRDPQSFTNIKELRVETCNDKYKVISEVILCIKQQGCICVKEILYEKGNFYYWKAREIYWVILGSLWQYVGMILSKSVYIGAR